MIGDTHYQRYLPESSEDLVQPEEIRRHILCSGETVLRLNVRRMKLIAPLNRPSLLHVVARA